MNNQKNQRINILFIESGTSGGGSFKSLTMHISALDKSKYKAVIICFNDTLNTKIWLDMGCKVFVLNNHVYSIKHNLVSFFYKKTFSRIIRYFDYWIIAITKFYHFNSIKKICNIIDREKIDIIHLNVNIYRDLYGVIAAQKKGVRCISHLRSSIQFKLSKRFLYFVNKHVDIFIANSNSTMEHFISFGIEKSKIKMIYNALEINFVNLINIYKELSIPRKFTRIIGCVASMYNPKGHRFLLKVFQELSNRSNDYYLVLIGDGPLKEELQIQAKQLKIENHVLFAGYKLNAIDFIKSFDILVIPSEKETFGRSVLEGMLVETPVVATNVGGIPEIITHDETGLMVDYDDEEAFANAIELVFQDKDLNNKIVNNALARAKDLFGIKKYIDKIDSIYS